MSNSNGVISAPVNTDDVSSVIGENSHDVATLCMSQKINGYAKYKPEAVGDQTELSLEMRKNNNFGLVPQAFYNGKTALINAVKNGTFNGGWKYVRPGENHWKRLTDFVGYNHNARSPFGDLLPGTFIISSDTTRHLYIPASPPPPDEDALNLSDFQMSGYNYKNWYFGVLLYNTSNTLMATTTTDLSNPQADWQVDFGNTVGVSYKGTYKGVPFLASKPFTLNGAEPSDLRLIGVGNQGVEIKLETTTDQYPLIVACSYPDMNVNQISYTVQIVNNTSTSKTFSNVTLHIASNMQGANATTLKSFGTVTVPANSSWIKSETVAVAYNGIASSFFQWARLSYTGATDGAWISFETTAQPEVPDYA